MLSSSGLNNKEKKDAKNKKPTFEKRIAVYEQNGHRNSFDPKIVNQINGDSHTYLSYAVAHHFRLFTKVLLEHKADPNQINEHGRLPLVYAAQGECVEIAKMLLEHKADPHKKDDWGDSGYSRASEAIRSLLGGPKRS